jgi:hypothetical protein
VADVEFADARGETPSTEEVRGVIPFLVAVLVLAIVGTLLWKVMSAQAAQATKDGGSTMDAPTGPTRAARPRPVRTVAPDDDPEFLRSLDERIRRSGREDPPAA